MKRAFAALAGLLLFSVAAHLRAQAEPAPVRIGVMAYRGIDEARTTWQPTAEYLEQQIPGRRFVIVPLEYSAVSDAVAKREIDFVLTNPLNYVEIESRYGATRIATLATLYHGVASTHYAGVIFCRADRYDLTGLRDLAGKSYIATDRNSLGGWWAAWRELQAQGINPDRDFSRVRAGQTQDAVVYAVRDGAADAGTVRAGTLEQMAAEGKVQLAEFRILNQQPDSPLVPFARSTRIYPEGPIARLEHVSDDLARDVTVALLRLPADSPAAKAARIAGWTIPLDYSPVHELMRELRQGPYKDFGKVTLGVAARQYRYWIIAIAVIVAILLVTSVYLLMLNRRLTRPVLEAEIGLLAARLKMLSGLAARLVIVVGAVVLLGWALEIEPLKRIFPGLVAMNPITAVSFILAGVGLLAMRRGGVTRIVGGVCGIVIVVAGVLVLANYLYDWDSGIDRLLFHDRLDAPSTNELPNRMAPNTALNFALVGAALLLLNVETRRGRRPAQGLAFLSALLALFALVGYAYGVKPLIGVASFIPMALHTAGAFLLMSLAILWALPDRGFMAAVTSDSAGGVLARRLLPACILVPALFGWLRLEGERAGLFGAELGVSLHSIANIIFFLILVWWNATLLFRADAERRRADAALRESEQRHRAVVEQASEGIILTDADSRQIIEANAAMAKLLDYPIDRLIGLPVYELIDDTRQGVDERIEKVLSAKMPLVGERQFKRRDGTLVDVESSAVVVEWGGRRVIFTAVRDITERKRAREALDAERALLRTVIDNLPDRIYVKGVDGRYELDNAAHLKQIGVTDPQQVIGKRTSDFFPPEVAARYEADDQAILESGRPINDREERTIDKDGNERWLLTTKVPLTDGQAKIVGVVGMSRDITERRRAQRMVEQKNVELQQSIESEHRAHEQLKSAQSQLVQTEKLASLGQMVAGVAHEINNPLSFVSNNVAVLERDAKALGRLLELYTSADELITQGNAQLADEIKDLAGRIDLSYTLNNIKELTARSRDGLKRIQQIVKDLRDFARLDRGEQQDCDLNAGIESTVNIILGRAKKKQVQLVKELGKVPLYTCHGAKLNQVVMNLIANAIDASHEGGTVTIRSGTDNGVVRISVIDKGTGIAPEARQRLFDPFFTTKPPGEGTGLGLSISYGIVRDHGGTIDVESEPGEGSTFTITLPIVPRTGT